MERNLRRNEAADDEAITASSDVPRTNRWRRLFMRSEAMPVSALLASETNKDSEEEDDDEEEDATPSSRRARRILKRLGFFRADKPTAEKPESGHTPLVLPIDRPSTTPEQSAVDSGLPDAKLPRARTNESPVIEQAAPETTPVADEESTQEVEDPVTVAEQDEAASEQPELRPDAGGEDEPPEPPVAEYSSTASGGEPQRRPRVETVPTPVMAEAVPERTVVSTAAPVRVERFANPEPWGKLATSGVVVESLFRHRADREIRKEVKRGDEALQKQVDQQKFTTARMERNLQETRNRSNVVEQDLRQQQFEQRAAAVFERQQVTSPKPEAASMSSADVKPERITDLAIAPELIAPVMLKPEVHNDITVANELIKMPDTQKFVEAHIEPAVMMERVAAAAEKNVPLERAYERRHEVKDDPGTQALGGASSIGSILSGGGGFGFGDSNVTSTLGDQPASFGPQPKVDQSRATPVNYSTAALGGFAAAVVIIVLGVIAYLTMR